MATETTTNETIPTEAFRPSLRAVFQRGPDGLTLHWVAERERRDGEIQIIVGDLIPGPVPAGPMETHIAAN